jgi:hypothetical protein
MCVVLRDTSYWQTPLPPLSQVNIGSSEPLLFFPHNLPHIVIQSYVIAQGWHRANTVIFIGIA